MKHEIHGFTLEKQQEKNFCWASAAQAVRKFYNMKPISQHEINKRFGDHPPQGDRNFAVSGNPHGPLADVGCSDSEVSYFPDPITDPDILTYVSGRLVINVLRDRPTIAQMRSIDSGNKFSHALIITGVDVDQQIENSTLTLADPGRPEVLLYAKIREFLQSWVIYGTHPDLNVRARRIIYSNPPPDNLATAFHQI